ncbi:hypothetical protein VNO78_32747 [Psophocarpus tetragonolobus]|uniref:Response regulatory domain-containing protein n=1 Tax=Psophocarpus tetragonolobus TaxID=3891 RepID=A0AAN9NZX2_PSOTE
MACDRVDITVLVVDDDNTSLAIVANILNALGYKVLTANGALHALETLREFGSFIDLMISELHLSGMNEFEFQKHVENEFHIPVIIMSADRRETVISKSLTNGAAHFIFKPFCANDFKDIWQYAMDARKKKQTTGNTEGESLPGVIQDVNSTTSSKVSKRKRKSCTRKSTQMNKDGESEERSRLVKKPKVVWTAYLHNRFLLAIKQIGLDKAVPKTILDVMNVPNLTRENVASHLQKYRIFLRKVADKGLLEGLSNRDLKSRFATGLSPSVIKDFQATTAKSRLPLQQYMKRLANQTGYIGSANAINPYNHVSRSPYVTNNRLGRCHQFRYPCDSGLNMMLQNQHGHSMTQARRGVQSNFATNAGVNNIQQKMLGSYANQPYYAKSSYNNAGAVFQSDGTIGHDLMTSTNGLRGGVKFGEHQLMYPNHGSLGKNHNFSYGQRNWNMGSLNNSNNNLPWTTSTHTTSNNIQRNGGAQMVGNAIQGGFNSTVGIMDSIANNNRFGLMNGTTQNANKNVAPFGLSQGGFASASASAPASTSASACTSSAGEGWSSELTAALISIINGTREENIPGNPQLPQQLHGNVAENNNANSMDKGNSHMEYDLSNLFLMLDGMELLTESNNASDVIVNPNERTLNLSNESPASSHRNSNQMGGGDGIVDMQALDRFMVENLSSASNLAADQASQHTKNCSLLGRAGQVILQKYWLLSNNGTTAENILGNLKLSQQLNSNVTENDNATSINAYEGNAN